MARRELSPPGLSLWFREKTRLRARPGAAKLWSRGRVLRTVWTARGQAGACPPPDHTRRSRAHRSTAPTAMRILLRIKKMPQAASFPHSATITRNPPPDQCEQKARPSIDLKRETTARAMRVPDGRRSGTKAETGSSLADVLSGASGQLLTMTCVRDTVCPRTEPSCTPITQEACSALSKISSSRLSTSYTTRPAQNQASTVQLGLEQRVHAQRVAVVGNFVTASDGHSMRMRSMAESEWTTCPNLRCSRMQPASVSARRRPRTVSRNRIRPPPKAALTFLRWTQMAEGRREGYRRLRWRRLFGQADGRVKVYSG